MSSSQNSSSSDARPPAEVYAPLHDVICRVEVMLGTAAISVRDCLSLRADTVVPLDKAAGLDMEVKVNGVLVAYGEVVILDESTAIRVTELAAPPSSEATE
jgi:flagellar motor switch protein FliN